MCLGKAYIAGADRNELMAENVASVKVENGSLVITTILRQTKRLEAAIESIDFSNGIIILRPTQ